MQADASMLRDVGLNMELRQAVSYRLTRKRIVGVQIDILERMLEISIEILALNGSANDDSDTAASLKDATEGLGARVSSLTNTGSFREWMEDIRKAPRDISSK